METQTFGNWLQQHESRNDAVGDLARLARRDRSAPRWSSSSDVWYIHFRHHLDEMPDDALAEAFHEYETIAGTPATLSIARSAYADGYIAAVNDYAAFTRGTQPDELTSFWLNELQEWTFVENASPHDEPPKFSSTQNQRAAASVQHETADIPL